MDPESRSAHILVVDDEPDLEPLIRQMMRSHIRSGRYDFHFAGNGAEALDLLSAHGGFDLLVTDISMPTMDGLTLLGRVASAYPDIKSVVVSAYGDMGNIRAAMNRGAFDFVTKPLDFQDFEITIERALDHIARWKEVLRSRDRLVVLENELDVARGMQQAILPVCFPRGEDYDVHGTMAPARNVSGDFFEVLDLEHDRLGLVVADVSDKGIPAALFMMSSRTLLKGSAIGLVRPDRVLAEVNDLLHADNPNFMFVTMLYATYDPRTGKVTYANGGHCNPVVVRADGSAVELPGTRGVALGLAPGIEYAQCEVVLAPGETLVLYTDGVSEANDPRGEEFGRERLKAAFADKAPSSARRACAGIVDAVEAFAAGEPQSDDVTCLALHRSGGSCGGC